MEDIQIVELYWRRSQSAISESDKKYGKMLRRISFGILSSNEDSEECVNDTYKKAWDFIPPQRPQSLSAYLGKITRNISINRWHENRTEKRGGNNNIMTELTDCIPSSHTVDAEIDERELSAAISRWLYTLPKDDRILFVRRYWYGDSLDELSVKNSTTSNKLAGRLFRLREKLKNALEKENLV